MGESAMSEGCCQPILHNSTEQWGNHDAHSSAWVHMCWFIANNKAS